MCIETHIQMYLCVQFAECINYCCFLHLISGKFEANTKHHREHLKININLQRICALILLIRQRVN